MGLLTYAYAGRARRPGARDRPASGSSASSRRRSSRASARVGLASAISPNERLQQLFHPWTSYVIVPLFALANAGIAIDGGFLSRRAHLADHARHPGRLRRSASRSASSARSLARHEAEPRPRCARRSAGPRVAGGGAIAGHRLHGLAADRRRSPSTASELRRGEARRARRGARARRSLTWLVFRATALLPRRLRIRALLGTAEAIVDLAVPVDPERDHIRGPADAPVTLRRVRRLRVPVLRPGRAGRARAARRLRRPPLRLAPPAAHRRPPARAARRRGGRGRRRRRARSGRCTTCCSTTRTRSRPSDLRRLRRAARPRRRALRRRPARRASARRGSPRTSTSADLSGVSGTPTFFVNGRRHHGAYDIDTLSAAVKVARARAAIRPARELIRHERSSAAGDNVSAGSTRRFFASKRKERGWQPGLSEWTAVTRSRERAG